MAAPLFSPHIVGQSINRHIKVQLDPAGNHFLNYQTWTRVVQRGHDDILEIDIPSCLRHLWDILCDRDGHVDYVIGPDEQDHMHVRWTGTVEGLGQGTDDSLWTVWHLDTSVADPPIPVVLS